MSNGVLRLHYETEKRAQETVEKHARYGVVCAYDIARRDELDAQAEEITELMMKLKKDEV